MRLPPASGVLARAALLALAPATLAREDGWYRFQPSHDGAATITNAAAWLDHPAGRRGGIVTAGDSLACAGTAVHVRLWGLTLAGPAWAPEPEHAEAWAAQIAALGMNAVRLQCPPGTLWTPGAQPELVAPPVARLDAFTHALGRAGIHYTFALLDAADTNPDAGAAPAIPNADHPDDDGSLRGLERLLQHVNPLTGSRYADDPALAGIEYPADPRHPAHASLAARVASTVRATGYRGPLVETATSGAASEAAQTGLVVACTLATAASDPDHGEGTPAPAFPDDVPGGFLLRSGPDAAVPHPLAVNIPVGRTPRENIPSLLAVAATYGLGLQGWDALHLQIADAERLDHGGAAGLPALRTFPEAWILHPALSRMLLRGDVLEGPRIGGPATAELRAIGRAGAAAGGLTSVHAADDQGILRAATGQVEWDRSRPGRGFFTLDAPGTCGLVGWPPSEPVLVGDARLAFEGASPACVLLSSLYPEQSVVQARHLLLTVVGGSRRAAAEEAGTAAVELEPLVVHVRFEDRALLAVFPLTHDGRQTERQVLPPDGYPRRGITLDGRRDRTPFYLLVTD